MRRRLALFAFAVFVIAMPEFVAAQGRGSANKSPKATRPAATKPVKATGAGKVKATGAGKIKTTKSPQTKKTTKSTTAAATTTPSTTTTTTTTTTTETNPKALPKNARLVERLQKLLPSGTDMTEAATGFRNQGQFIAAVHASSNLDVDFADLKAHMVDDGMSLGQAIKKMKPGADAETEATRATSQAQTSLRSTQ